jgi:hypothetical protein
MRKLGIAVYLVSIVNDNARAGFASVKKSGITQIGCESIDKSTERPNAQDSK